MKNFLGLSQLYYNTFDGPYCILEKSTGWMADFGEYTPMYAQTGFDGRWWNEEYNEILHGYLPQDWASLNR